MSSLGIHETRDFTSSMPVNIYINKLCCK